MAPRLRQLSKRYKNKVAFGKINIDNHKEVGQRYHVMGIPNLVFYSYGEKVTNLVGVKPISEIQNKIDDILIKFENPE
jgi:thioredoxin 1